MAEDIEVATDQICEMSWLPESQCSHCRRDVAWWEE